MKKIVFICGALEKGKNGVGDYTRRLSAELIRTGNQAKIIALNDSYVTKTYEEFQHEEGIPVSVIRFPAMSQWNDRIKKANQFIGNFQPDFLSLQYVPFSFDDRGLPRKLAETLKAIANHAKWHIMFHELWIGIDEQSSVKHKLMGFVQRQIAKEVVKTLVPTTVHTQTKLYQHMLKRMGWNAILLPLFGNIPVSYHTNTGLKKSDSTLGFVLFGGIHYGAPVRSFIEELTSFTSEKGIKAEITFIGCNGKEIGEWVSECVKAFLPVTISGEQSPHVISEVLLKADFGITTTPIILTEKSGSVAAMREHHLPVICVARKWKPRGTFAFVPDANIYEYNTTTFKAYLQQYHFLPDSLSISSIANQFLNDLT